MEAPPHTVMNESDKSLVNAARSVFADDLIEEEVPEISGIWPDSDAAEMAQSAAVHDASAVRDERADQIASTVKVERAAEGEGTGTVERPDFGRPSQDDMIRVRGGGLYLPVRRRVVWMRGAPRPHPDWTIDTIAEKVVEGAFKRAGGAKGEDIVEGGYARYRANLFDETGRLIATGTKTEYSERFLDFAEKAETGSIGRCLAVGGYGTEAAADLDEGLEKERIADAPVYTRPINITASTIPGVRPGGRPAGVTSQQLHEIARVSRALSLGSGLIPIMEEVTDREVPPMEEGVDANKEMLKFLETCSFEEAGKIVVALTKALKARQEAGA